MDLTHNRVGVTGFARERLRMAGFCVVLSVGSFLVPGDARAENLFDALVSAYIGNPTLKAARSSLRATDEEVPKAHSGWRPTVKGTGDVTYQDTDSKPASTFDGDFTSKSYGVTLTQPIFRGFRTLNSIREAEANVRAGRQDLKGTEQSTLLSGVTSYVDVVRDQAIVRLRQNNVEVLSEQLQATRDRFDVGEVTKTDVAQGQARRAGSVSDLNLAQANLKTSRATYEQIIGHPPSNAREPKRLTRILPRSLPQAIDVGIAENPEITSAVFRENASRHAIDKVRGELLPEVSFETSYQRTDDPSVLLDEREAVTVLGRVTVPLYQAGEVSARIRQSKQTHQQQRDLVQAARDKVRSDIVAAWSQLVAARAKLTSDQAQVDANKTALSGVKEEERVGQRTILDVLDAEQELLNSQVGLVTTRRDLIVASFSVLSSIGRLTATDLGLPVDYYDPEEHYYDVRRKWFGTGAHVPRSDFESVDESYRR